MLAKESREPTPDPLDANDDALVKYFNEVADILALSANEELELARRKQDGDKEAKDRLVRSGLQLVLDITREYQHVTWMTPQDKIEEGNLGLLRAVEGFSEETIQEGQSLHEYASYWINQSIKRAAINSSRTRLRED